MKAFALAVLIVALAAPVAAQDSSEGPATLVLTFEVGVEAGAVLVSLFDSEAAFAGGAPVRGARIEIVSGQRAAIFRELPPGDYAARAFHDIDGNGRMTNNPFGLPAEPYAFSNNARGNMGPATWGRARFRVEGETAQTITLR